VTERLPLDQTAAVCAALGYAGFYHVHYDNMMLFPLLLALVVAAFRHQRHVLFAAAAVLGIVCYAEPGLIVGAAQTSAFIRWFIFLCPLAAVLIKLFSTPRSANSPAA
jgi:Ca2+/Na+ antiporter